MTVLRHILSVVLLPFTVVVIVPYWLLTGSSRSPASYELQWLAATVAGALFVTGFAVFAWCVTLFAKVGRGTLAPWDPTRAMVAVGPYRYVRNPMISAVASMLLAEALWWRSIELLGWCALFVLVNHIYFIVVEEPGLERRFGESYRRYRARVPRWLPLSSSKRRTSGRDPT